MEGRNIQHAMNLRLKGEEVVHKEIVLLRMIESTKEEIELNQVGYDLLVIQRLLFTNLLFPRQPIILLLMNQLTLVMKLYN